MGNDASKGDHGEVVYEDARVRVFERAVEVKKYYFPAANSKVVPVQDIEEVIQGEVRGGRLWGLSLGSNVWWALGDGQATGHCVLKLKGHSLLVGFDVCITQEKEGEKEKEGNGAPEPSSHTKQVVQLIKKIVDESKSK